MPDEGVGGVMKLVEGEKYLLDISPWGIQSVQYLGPSRWLPETHSRVRNPITRHTFIIHTNRLKPILRLVKDNGPQAIR